MSVLIKLLPYYKGSHTIGQGHSRWLQHEGTSL